MSSALNASLCAHLLRVSRSSKTKLRSALVSRWRNAESHESALPAAHPAVDGHHRLGPAEVALEAPGQVVERVAVLGEDQELAPPARLLVRLGLVGKKLDQPRPLGVAA